MTRRLGLGIVVVVALAALAAWRWWPRDTPDPSTDAGLVDAAAVLLEPGPRGTGLDAAPCRVSGRVVRSSDGTGVANATVSLQRPRRMGGPAPVLARTDAVGQWSVTDLVPGSYTVSTTASDLAPRLLRNVVFDPGKDHNNVDVVLDDAAAELGGRLTDATGKPIAEARIDLSRTVDQAMASGSAIITTSDADGRYHLGIEHDTYDLLVTHRDHVATSARVVIPAGVTSRTRDFELVPGGTIRGRVTATSDAHAIEGAVVHLRAGSLGFASASDGSGAHATTTADGSFELRGVAAGTAELMAIAPGFASIESTSVPIGIAEAVDDIELRVDTAYTISGFVVDAGDDTSGIPEVSMNFVDYGNPSRARISEPTGPDGAFVAHGVLPGHYSLIVMGDTIVPDMRTTLVVGEQNRDDVLVRAGRGVHVRGHVTPPGPAIIRFAVPLTGTTVTADGLSLMARTMSTFRVASSTADGAFEFGPVAPGEYLVEARTDVLRGVVPVDVDPTNTPEITVTMTPGLVLRGRVVDAEARVVPGVTIAMTRQGGAQRLSLSSRRQGTDGPSAVTGDDGRFELAGIDPGEYAYLAQDERLLRMPWHTARVGDSGQPEQALEDGRIVLDADREIELVVASARALTGRVVDESGTAVVGAWVTAWPTITMTDLSTLQAGQAAPSDASADLLREASRMLAVPPVLTDAEGRFVLAGLRRDRYSVSAQAERGELQADLTDFPVTDQPTLTIRPLATLHATLAADDVPGGELEVVLEGDGVRSFALRETREFTVPRLPAGSWRVMVEAEGGVASQDVELKAGATHELAIDLAPWARVRGRVLDQQTGKPTAGVYAMVATPTDTVGGLMARASGMVAAMSGGGDTRLDGDGRFDVGRLAPGVVTVNFVAMPGFETVATLRLDDLAPGETREFDRVDALVFETVAEEARGWVGLDLDLAKAGDDGPRTIVVEAVVPGSPAARAGVQAGDVVTAVEGHEVARHGAAAVRNGIDEVHLRRGTRVRLRFDRAGKTRDVVLVAAAPRKPKP